jgi:hypothetical protein
MGLFDFLRDPASLWVPEPGLKIEIDLEEASFCGVRFGSRVTSLSKLGPPTNPKPTKRGYYTWKQLGLEVQTEKKMGIVEWYCITINPVVDDGLDAYPGKILRAGTLLPLGPASREEDLVRALGEPWHVFVDDEDPDIARTLFYETRTLEWEIEVLKSGTLHSILLNTPPSMEDPQTRKRLNCEKTWPPA